LSGVFAVLSLDAAGVEEELLADEDVSVLLLLFAESPDEDFRA
jgi:hypothetical protein